MKLRDLLLPQSWRTPPVIKAEPAWEPEIVAVEPPDLRRFSLEELRLAIQIAVSHARIYPTDPASVAMHGVMIAILRHRREKNRLARKQSKPAPVVEQPVAQGAE